MAVALYIVLTVKRPNRCEPEESTRLYQGPDCRFRHEIFLSDLGLEIMEQLSIIYQNDHNQYLVYVHFSLRQS